MSLLRHLYRRVPARSASCAHDNEARARWSSQSAAHLPVSRHARLQRLSTMRPRMPRSSVARFRFLPSTCHIASRSHKAMRHPWSYSRITTALLFAALACESEIATRPRIDWIVERHWAIRAPKWRGRAVREVRPLHLKNQFRAMRDRVSAKVIDLLPSRYVLGTSMRAARP